MQINESFYERFERLCKKHNTTPSAVCIKIGYSKATSSYWKKSQKIPKREALEKIAELFDVTVDYLACKSDFSSIQKIEIPPIQTNRREMFNILSKLSDQELDELLHYAEYLLSKRPSPEEPADQ